jgi:hypothetical protein
MRDSISVPGIPVQGCDIGALYCNGLYQADPGLAARHFGDIPIAWIDCFGTDPTADVLDVEKGDATPVDAAVWVAARLALKPSYPPVVYCNRMSLTPLFNALNAAGLQIVTHFRLWVATLDGTKALPDMTGVTAVQYEGMGSYDESVVYDDTWLAPPPVPDPPPVKLKKGDTMIELPPGVKGIVAFPPPGATKLLLGADEGASAGKAAKVRVGTQGTVWHEYDPDVTWAATPVVITLAGAPTRVTLSRLDTANPTVIVTADWA